MAVSDEKVLDARKYCSVRVPSVCQRVLQMTHGVVILLGNKPTTNQKYGDGGSVVGEVQAADTFRSYYYWYYNRSY